MAVLILGLAAAYGAAGLAVGLAFLLFGLARLDPAAPPERLAPP